MLHRVVPWASGAGPEDEGGSLYVARLYQGAGRHDNPDTYGALYASRLPAGAVAERLQRFRNQTLADTHLAPSPGIRYALVRLDDLRPSRVATHDREVTRPVALRLYEEGFAGFEWWSTIEASWINVTLFAERAMPRLTIAEEPEPLTLQHTAVRDAAEALGIRLAA
jgi:hypothetical protein